MNNEEIKFYGVSPQYDAFRIVKCSLCNKIISLIYFADHLEKKHDIKMCLKKNLEENKLFIKNEIFSEEEIKIDDEDDVEVASINDNNINKKNDDNFIIKTTPRTLSSASSSNASNIADNNKNKKTNNLLAKTAKKRDYNGVVSSKTQVISPTTSSSLSIESTLSPSNIIQKPIVENNFKKTLSTSLSSNLKTKLKIYDPDKHCGVSINGSKPCMRSLTCKKHSINLRRQVEGRSKSFNELFKKFRNEKIKQNQITVVEQTTVVVEPKVESPIIESKIDLDVKPINNNDSNDFYIESDYPKPIAICTYGARYLDSGSNYLVWNRKQDNFHSLLTSAFNNYLTKQNETKTANEISKKQHQPQQQQQQQLLKARNKTPKQQQTGKPILITMPSITPTKVSPTSPTTQLSLTPTISVQTIKVEDNLKQLIESQEPQQKQQQQQQQRLPIKRSNSLTKVKTRIEQPSLSPIPQKIQPQSTPTTPIIIKTPKIELPQSHQNMFVRNHTKINPTLSAPQTNTIKAQTTLTPKTFIISNKSQVTLNDKQQQQNIKLIQATIPTTPTVPIVTTNHVNGNGNKKTIVNANNKKPQQIIPKTSIITTVPATQPTITKTTKISPKKNEVIILNGNCINSSHHTQPTATTTTTTTTTLNGINKLTVISTPTSSTKSINLIQQSPPTIQITKRSIDSISTSPSLNSKNIDNNNYTFNNRKYIKLNHNASINNNGIITTQNNNNNNNVIITNQNFNHQQQQQQQQQSLILTPIATVTSSPSSSAPSLINNSTNPTPTSISVLNTQITKLTIPLTTNIRK